MGSRVTLRASRSVERSFTPREAYRNRVPEQCVVLLPDENGRSSIHAARSQTPSLHGADPRLRSGVYDNGRIAGGVRTRLPGAEAVYVPIERSRAMPGCWHCLPVHAAADLSPRAAKAAETFLTPDCAAIERVAWSIAGAAGPDKGRDRKPAQPLLREISMICARRWQPSSRASSLREGGIVLARRPGRN